MEVKKIKKEEALMVAIDFQEKLMPVMNEKEALEAAMVKLVKGCRTMDVPILVTQQYTKGLGETIPSINMALTEEIAGKTEAYEPFEKTSFSAMRQADFAAEIKKQDRKTILVTGIESHICVEQTVLDLLDNGYQVFVVGDCISSRKVMDKEYAQLRMIAAGAVFTSMESVLFELCGGAKEAGFKGISAIIK
ncbi:isochorismatase family protein [Sinanaerobacter sp. ZZT-01]|uniref:isochorismatase family protein n=1 Tax=Sinanaerobacter sp. ZZT-01 TaxID=3111540 RepID=UPI002D76508A|nr:isochorismatase family protein [Sinanaerobacter sp. ZZT-01]WRR94834.1 isochorismatase family protein [Sinanaerobacter sp. ZZT-01]